MARRTISYFLFTLLAGSAMALAEHPDLSGNWELDLGASDFAGTPRPSSGEMTISTSPHKVMHVSVAVQGPISQLTNDSEWKVDDHYHPVNGTGGGEVLAKWDNGVLVARRQLKSGAEEIRLRLAPGGEALTESIDTGSNVITLIWHRQ